MQLLLLFLQAFLSATILPFPSEAVVVAMVIEGTWSVWEIMLSATVGNWLGSMTTYYLGYLGNWDRIAKWARIEPEEAQKYMPRVRRWGVWLGLLGWMPVVGDILVLCMGLVRCDVLKSAIAVLVGKSVRYAFVIWGVECVM